jgi:hypothetical protein
MDSAECNLSDFIPQSGHISHRAFLQLQLLRLFLPDVLSVLEPVISQFLHRFCLYLDHFNSEHGTAFLLSWRTLYPFVLGMSNVGTSNY